LKTQNKITKRITRLFLWGILFIHFKISAQQFNFRNYSVDDGVGQSQVYALHQDSRGYLWMGTRGGGLTRFDGVNFKSYTLKDGLINNYIFCIREDSAKNLWIGTNDGLSMFNGIEFKNFKPEKLNAQLWVESIAFDKKGLMWLGTNLGVYTFDGKEFTRFKFREAIVNAVFCDHKGNIWIGSSWGVYRVSFNGSTTVTESFGEKNGIKKNSMTCFEEDGTGNIWMGTYGDGLYVFDGKSFRRIDPSLELFRQTVLDIYDDKNGNTWIATLAGGVCRYNKKEKSFNWLTETEGLSNNHVRSILKDSWGNFWFGTSGGGVCNYFGQLFTHYTKENGLRSNFIYEIFKDSRGVLWLADGDKGVCSFDGQTFTCYGEDEGFGNLKVKAIAEDESGLMIFGTDGQGTWVYDGRVFYELEEFKKKYVRDIKRDRNGFLWMATAGNGIYKFKMNGTVVSNSGFLNITAKNKLPHNRLSCLHIDRNNRVWAGTENNGLALIMNDKVVYNLTSDEGIAANSIRCLDEDNSGYLWLGTAGNGISSFPLYKKRVYAKKYDHLSGLTSSNIYLLSHENNNYIFVGTESGLDRLTLDKDKNIIDVKHYSKTEGFTGIETCQGAVYSEPNSVTWFGTINGLTRYNPQNKFKNDRPPKINFTDIRLFYDPISQTEYSFVMGDWNKPVKKIILAHDKNNISFDFIGLNFSNPEKVLYKWKLEGSEKEWSPARNQRTVTYSNLPPGDYTFLLKACNEDQVWTETPEKISFQILRPFWQQWWFIAAAILLAGGIIAFFYRRRLKNIERKADEEKQKLELEKNMLELEQKALRLQMNPHFIFNALNSIQSQIGEGNEQTARYYLAKFAKLMRKILDNSRVPLITLEEEIETLDNYLLIEKFAGGDKFDYEIKVNPSIEQDYIKIPPMLLQPFAENAIKHGFKNIDKKGLLRISFEEKDGYVECSLTDNGIGREKAGELKQKSESFHKSTALMVTQERLDLIRKIENLQLIEISDLLSENGQPSGTKVVIRIPI
jgi:ligand-binding sensor domain-containing protein